MSREAGDKLETEISQRLGAKKNTNSGATWRNADLSIDISGLKAIIEAKVRSKEYLLTRGFRKDLEKLEDQAGRIGADYILIVQDATGKKRAVLDLGLLEWILRKN